MEKRAFTLAEVLITLAIIGVVAAMTIPTLIAKINNIVTDNQVKVFNAKLIKGFNLTKTAGDLNDTYSSTYDFLVNGLGKNLKMAKICDKDHIRDCIPYDKIKYDDDNTEKAIEVKDITNAGKLNLKAPYEDVAAFVLADGTPAIVSYNKQCIDDPDKADTTINACLAGVYDLNGTRKPNKYAATFDTDGKTVKAYTGDLRAFNGASIGSSCISKIGDVCIAATAVVADSTMLPLIQAVDSSYTMPTVYSTLYGGTSNDYWQLATDYCSKVKNGAHLPDSSELAKIARALYKVDTIPDKNEYNKSDIYYWDVQYDANKVTIYAALGIPSTDSHSGFSLWSSSPLRSDREDLGWLRYFPGSSGNSTTYKAEARPYQYARAVCLGD